MGSFRYLGRARTAPPSACGISPRSAGGEGNGDYAQVSRGGAGRHAERPEQRVLESGEIMVGHPGLEPGTSVLSGLRSNLLS